MVKRVLCIAPHPDDETLGCGGTLLRHLNEGDDVHWLIVTSISRELGFSEDRIAKRAAEIDSVHSTYGFAATHQCGLPTMRLDTVPMVDIIGAIGGVVREIEPDTLYLPYRNDAHSDHAAVFDAGAACSKSFRYPSVKSVHVYEVLSETEFGLKPEDAGFRPNRFVDITAYLDQKVRIMALFEGEMGTFPFPRSDTCIRALAQLRGSQAGLMAAEGFMTVKDIV